MPEVELSSGPIEYEDSGGDGPVMVLSHGLIMDGRVWDDVVAELAPDFRCLRPTFPLGAHRRPMRPDADLTLRGMGKIVAEFLEALELDDVTLVFNDWSCGQTMIADGLVDRVGAIAFVSCEAYEGYPPGLPGRIVWLSAKLPGGMRLMRRTLAGRRIRRLPVVYGNLSKRGVPDDLLDDWLVPFARPEIQRDLRRYAGDAMRGRKLMFAATPALRRFDKPALVAWAREDKLLPVKLAHRLAADLPNSRLVEIDDSYTLVPRDQPVLLAAELRTLAAREGASSATGWASGAQGERTAIFQRPSTLRRVRIGEQHSE